MDDRIIKLRFNVLNVGKSIWVRENLREIR
jgi:hypothetical protein